MKDYYRILHVGPGADRKAIKAAYRRAVRRHHPDVAKSRKATPRFIEIQEAYEVLSDPDRRRIYDSLMRDTARPRVAAARGPRHRSEPEWRPLARLVIDVLGIRVGASFGAVGSPGGRRGHRTR